MNKLAGQNQMSGRFSQLVQTDRVPVPGKPEDAKTTVV